MKISSQNCGIVFLQPLPSPTSKSRKIADFGHVPKEIFCPSISKSCVFSAKGDTGLKINFEREQWGRKPAYGTRRNEEPEIRLKRRSENLILILCLESGTAGPHFFLDSPQKMISNWIGRLRSGVMTQRKATHFSP
jgi:hypothetical protein